MRRAVARISEWVARRERGISLALFRIGLGLCVLNVIVPMLATGVHELLLVDVSDGGFREIKGDWLLALLGGPTVAGVERLSVATGGGGAAARVGVGRAAHRGPGAARLHEPVQAEPRGGWRP